MIYTYLPIGGPELSGLSGPIHLVA